MLICFHVIADYSFGNGGPDTGCFTPAFFFVSKAKYYISIIIHVILSLWLWILFFEMTCNKSFFDTPRHIWMLMNLNGMICGVVVPRVILIICHFSGKLARIKSGGHVRWLTNTGADQSWL